MTSGATWTQPDARRVVITPRLGTGVTLFRYALGFVLLGGGLYFAVMSVLGPVSFLQDTGVAGLLEALPGMAVSLLFAALLGPLGWWISVVRTRRGVDGVSGTVFEFVDWKLGRKLTSHPTSDYRAVWVGRDQLADRNTGAGGGSNTIVIKVKLLSHNPRQCVAWEAGWFESDDSARARELAALLASVLSLPLVDDLGTARLGDPDDGADEE